MGIELKDVVCCGTHYVWNSVKLYQCGYSDKCPLHKRHKEITGTSAKIKLMRFTRVAEFRNCYKVIHQIFKNGK